MININEHMKDLFSIYLMKTGIFMIGSLQPGICERLTEKFIYMHYLFIYCIETIWYFLNLSYMVNYIIR